MVFKILCIEGQGGLGAASSEFFFYFTVYFNSNFEQNHKFSHLLFSKDNK